MANELSRSLQLAQFALGTLSIITKMELQNDELAQSRYKAIICNLSEYLRPPLDGIDEIISYARMNEKDLEIEVEHLRSKLQKLS